MSLYFRYRKNGGQVVGTSIKPFVETEFFGSIADPPMPNGRDLSTPKIHDNGTIRNATQNEISAFTLAERQDDNLQARSKALSEFDGHHNKIIRAVVLLALDHINVLRTNDGLPAISKRQAFDAIKAKISAGEAD